MSAAGTISLRGSGNTSFDDFHLMSDERLVAVAKKGQRAAFDDLYKRHVERMFRVAHRITRNHEDAEDAVQDCFFNAFLHLKSFDGRSRFSTWLTRIAINGALMKLRKNHASREIPMDEPGEMNELLSEHRLAESSLNPEERCAKGEREAILRRAIANLRPGIRKAIEIHMLQGCSLEETAEVLGTSVPAVKARVFHAKAALRKASPLQFIVPSIWTNSEPSFDAAR